jgi:hypothetical protein
VKASSRSKLWQGTVSGWPSRQPDSFYRTARGDRQHRPRGDPVGPSTAAMSCLPRRYDHRPRTATPLVPRRSAPSLLGAARNLSAVQKDLHDFARLVNAIDALQFALSTAGLRADCLWRFCRASSTALQRSVSLARFIHRAPMGPPSTAQHMVLGEASAESRVFFQPPTILAWDLGTLCNILPLEAKSP